jgi:hypothetical protein
MTPSPTRRVIRAGHIVCSLTLTGETPLLMSNADTDRESDTYLAYRTLSKKRGKTSEDETRLRELEWYTRLYFDEEVGVYIPGRNVKELLRSAATKWRKGEDVKRSLVVPDYRIPLIYDGPKDAASLWAEGFRYTTMVANSGASAGRVERTRPCFEAWSLKCDIAFDPSDLDLREVETFVERAEKYGLGDYRPEFGAFNASLEFLREQREDSNAEAVKPRDKKREAANSKHAERVMG